MIKSKHIVLTILMILFTLAGVSCSENTLETSVWESATYTEDSEVGQGEKTIYFELEAEDKKVLFTINTDKEILGDALTESELISGEQGPYGMYVKKINNITADYDVNKSFWSFYKNDEYMQTGVDSEKISGGENYKAVLTK